MSDRQKKHIAILESTGFIGTQALDVIAANPHKFQVEVLTAHSNADLLAAQALKFKANAVVIEDESKYETLRDRLFDAGIKVYCGRDALAQVVEMEEIHLVLTARAGFAGLESTLRAIEAGKNIAIAHKDILVIAGELVTRTAREKGVNIYPVNSRHSAIFQCLTGEFHNTIEKIYLTADGGPFSGKTRKELEWVTPEQAMENSNSKRGEKSTIDSATMMDKGFEVIETKWLFGVKPEKIDVIIHPQSIIHSMVQFEDGSIKAQMGLPDSKLPIQYAFGYPERIKTDFPRFEFWKYPKFTFEPPDYETFGNLHLAFSAMKKGGNAPCILNASNEIAVKAFLKKEIGFLAMSDIIASCLDHVTHIAKPTLTQYYETDQEARAHAASLIPAFQTK